MQKKKKPFQPTAAHKSCYCHERGLCCECSYHCDLRTSHTVHPDILYSQAMIHNVTRAILKLYFMSCNAVVLFVKSQCSAIGFPRNTSETYCKSDHVNQLLTKCK